jgi:hypothetical protein
MSGQPLEHFNGVYFIVGVLVAQINLINGIV